MSSEVVLLISILCLVKCTWCGNYGFGLGQRHSHDELMHQELLTNDAESNETVIKYTYVAEKPVTFVLLRTDTNIYTEITFSNSYQILITLSNFESMEFNATLTVYGFPWHPDGPEPDDDRFLLQPNAKKLIYLNKSSVEDSSIIATGGAYVSEEKSSNTYDDSNGAEENEDSDSSDSNSSSMYYDYDITKTMETISEEDREAQSIIDAIQDLVAKNESIVLKCNFVFIIFSYATILML